MYTQTTSYTPELWESFLLKLRYQKSRLLKTRKYQSILLNEPHTAWLVYTGYVDVFSVALVEGQPDGTRQHLFRAESGTLLFGTALEGMERGMVIMQPPESQLLRFERETLSQLAAETAFADLISRLIDTWLAQITELVAPKLAPKEYGQIEDSFTTGKTPAVARVKRWTRWITQTQGVSEWLGQAAFALTPGQPAFPLTARAWLTVSPESSLTSLSTSAFLQQPGIWEALDAFDRLIIDQLAEHAHEQMVHAQQTFLQQTEMDAARFSEALYTIANTLDAAAEVMPLSMNILNPLLAACEQVGAAMGIQIIAPPPSAGVVTLQTIAQTSRIRTRNVTLAGDWWRRDQGALLGYLADQKQPVALLPQTSATYLLVNPTNGAQQVITREVAVQIDPNAVQFYASLPAQPSTAFELLRFGLYGNRRDVIMLALTGLALGILNLSIPVGIGVLFNQMIPAGNKSSLVQIGLLLLLATLATFACQITQRIAILRLESRADMRLVEAVWDRLLGQKPGFFRQFSAGDLGMRVMGFGQIRSLLGELASTSLLESIVIVFNLGIMFLFNPVLGVFSLLLMIAAVLIMTLLGAVSLRYQREMGEATGKNMGYMLQYINGIRKFRVAGAESRVFSAWAGHFTHQRRVAFQMRALQNQIVIFSLSFPLFCIMLIFLLGSQFDTLSVGEFAAFFIAFTQFLSATLQLGIALVIASAVLPIYEQALPILQTVPEIPPGMVHPGELNGDIEISHVSFRYAPGQPLILDDLSFKVNRGDFVAIVGASGSGKSTLLRLMLGFEKPETGAVYYDQKDLNDLDIRAVRQQIGVVMQNTKMLAGGSLFENIIGISQDLTLDDAWEAARMVGLEKDIKAMPMGMQTLVTEGGSTLSGGQQQRLMIAASIVNKPRIIFFDEATSALDNRSQAIVMESLGKIDATRIVIAHRLSTVIHANHIIVMDSGHIVQIGTYDTLIKEPGLFAEMAKRQLA